MQRPGVCVGYAEREGEGAARASGGRAGPQFSAVEKREDQRKPDAFFGHRKADRQTADHA